jgi:hypothetical protein
VGIRIEGAGDATIPGATTIQIDKFGPTPVVGQYATYKVPPGAGGYNLPAGVKILKFSVQDQMPFGPNAANGPGDVYNIKSITFTAN